MNYDSSLELLVSNAQDPNATLLYNGKSSRMPKPHRVTFTPGHNRVEVLLEAEEEVMNNTSKACARHESLCLTVHLIWADLHSFHIPVLGLGYSIDTPVKVARFGISSVISINNLLADILIYSPY